MTFINSQVSEILNYHTNLLTNASFTRKLRNTESGQKVSNIDEKGFLIGIAGQATRIFSISALKSGKIRGAGTDGSREWISIIACVSAIGDRLPPTLIYKGVSGDLQTTWIQDFDPARHKANFVTSENGWTSNEIGFEWLKEIYEPQTRETCSNGLRKRLLIVDGHSSHVNRRFIDFCGDHGIVLLIFPPHTTHRLQPLDVSVFAPLGRAYTNSLNAYIARTSGFSRVTKRLFWSLFWPAWEKGVSLDNIKSGFEKTGIFPFNPARVIATIKWEPLQQPDTQIQPVSSIPATNRELRALSKSILRSKSGLDPAVQAMTEMAEKLWISGDIQRHQIKDLKETLREMKTKGKGKKSAGLLDPEKPNGPQIFTPGRIASNRLKWDLLEAERQRKEDEALQQKQARDLLKKEKEAMKLEKREIRQENARLRAIEKVEKQRQREELQKQKKGTLQAKLNQLAQVQAELIPTRAQRRNTSISINLSVVVEDDEQVRSSTRRGRIPRTPARFRT
jgi:hypothetical protein